MENLTNVTTGKVRLSYVHLFKPYAYQPGQEEKFQVSGRVDRHVQAGNKCRKAVFK